MAVKFNLSTSSILETSNDGAVCAAAAGTGLSFLVASTFAGVLLRSNVAIQRSSMIHDFQRGKASGANDKKRPKIERQQCLTVSVRECEKFVNSVAGIKDYRTAGR